MTGRVTHPQDSGSKDESTVRESADQVQRSIVEDFRDLEDWADRYQYLIELGRRLPPFPAAARIDANRLHGCQAGVWLVIDSRDGCLHFNATSDSTIVAGLIALLLKVYSGRTPREILETAPTFVDEIGLASHLSPNRANGLALMLARIRAAAAAHVTESRPTSRL